MQGIKKVVLFFVLTISWQTVFSQYEYLQINLEVHPSLKKEKNIRVSMFQEDSICYIGIKRNPSFDPANDSTWFKRDADRLIEINKEDFNRISEMSMHLSSSTILKGANPSVLTFEYDGTTIDLEIVVNFRDKISFSIWGPLYDTKERKLEPFVAVCKEILKLANLKPKKYLR